MSKHILNFIVTAILAYIFSFFMGWYSIMIAAFVTGFMIPLKRGAVFFIPFLAIFLSWAIHSFMLSSANDFILAKRIAELLSLGGNHYLLILVSAFIGGLAAGLAALLGNQLVAILKKN